MARFTAARQALLSSARLQAVPAAARLLRAHLAGPVQVDGVFMRVGGYRGSGPRHSRGILSLARGPTAVTERPIQTTHARMPDCFVAVFLAATQRGWARDCWFVDGGAATRLTMLPGSIRPRHDCSLGLSTSALCL
jgi:hypothetical protein